MHIFNRSAATRALVLVLCANGASAHEGHGLTGSHWHASDAWGFVALGILVAVAVWLSRDRK